MNAKCSWLTTFIRSKKISDWNVSHYDVQLKTVAERISWYCLVVASVALSWYNILKPACKFVTWHIYIWKGFYKPRQLDNGKEFTKHIFKIYILILLFKMNGFKLGQTNNIPAIDVRTFAVRVWNDNSDFMIEEWKTQKQGSIIIDQNIII